MKIRQKSRAFTLIELLVVISIIAVLAGIALPVFSQVQEKGAQTKALSNAKQIGLGCKLFATDNDGNFPQNVKTGGTGAGDPEPDFGTVPPDANVALKQLIPAYVPNESIFYLAKSKWTPNPPDEKITTAADRLTAGENHWAYVPSLSDTSNPNFPLLADGFSNTVGIYDPNESKIGGVWKAKKAVIIRADQSGTIEKVDQSDYKVKSKIGGTTKEDIFSVSSNGGNWIPTAPVNPLK